MMRRVSKQMQIKEDLGFVHLTILRFGTLAAGPTLILSMTANIFAAN